MNKTRVLCATAMLFPLLVNAGMTQDASHSVSDKVIENQRTSLASNTLGKGYGPQSPRDIDSIQGNNKRIFSEAPDYMEMNLCNIHFHKMPSIKAGSSPNMPAMVMATATRPVINILVSYLKKS